MFSMSEKANIISLMSLPNAIKQYEQCLFHTSLGLAPDCYLCRTFDFDSVQIKDCNEKYCSCSNLTTKSELLKHYVNKLIHFIDAAYAGETVYILEIGIKTVYNPLVLIEFKRLTPKIFCEILIKKSNNKNDPTPWRNDRTELLIHLCSKFVCEDGTRPTLL